MINRLSGWWLTYPSEKYESHLEYVGMMTFPNIWKIKNVTNHQSGDNHLQKWLLHVIIS
jgi:hypothetical protein